MYLSSNAKETILLPLSECDGPDTSGNAGLANYYLKYNI